MKGVSNDKVSSVYYSTKPETSSPYSKLASEEEDDGKSVCPSDSDFPSIDNSDYVKQLRVLTVLNEDFKVDLIPLYDEFMLSKNRIKRKYFQDNFAWTTTVRREHNNGVQKFRVETDGETKNTTPLSLARKEWL